MEANKARIIFSALKYLLFSGFILTVLMLSIELGHWEGLGYYYYARPPFEINESCNMRFPKYDVERGINGLYVHNNYFCVYTHQRSTEEIAATTFHELAHYFNDVEKEHFSRDFQGYNYTNKTI